MVCITGVFSPAAENETVFHEAVDLSAIDILRVQGQVRLAAWDQLNS